MLKLLLYVVKGHTAVSVRNALRKDHIHYLFRRTLFLQTLMQVNIFYSKSLLSLTMD